MLSPSTTIRRAARTARAASVGRASPAAGTSRICRRSITAPPGLRRGFTAKVWLPAASVTRWRELAPLANNLNQLARACNAGRVSAEIYPTLIALTEQVRLLRLELLGAVQPGRDARP